MRTQARLTVGANGKFDAFGKPWTYDAYATHGQNTIDIHVANMTLNPRYNAAIDAIKTAHDRSSQADALELVLEAAMRGEVLPPAQES